MKIKRVYYAIFEDLHDFPPCISQIRMLARMGIEVIVLYSVCRDEVRTLLQQEGVKMREIKKKRIHIKGIRGIVLRASFREGCLKAMKEGGAEHSVLWAATAETALQLTGVCQEMPRILSILELHDTTNMQMDKYIRPALGLALRRADAVTACERGRAAIMKKWYHLDRIPWVLPNKPYDHPQVRCMKELEQYKPELAEKLKGKKIICYQGVFSKDRDLRPLAQALAKLNQDYTLVLLGRDTQNCLPDLLGIYSRTMYLGEVTAPFHLYVTSYAHIGIAYYDESSLNNMFCAPNKIYEYTGFGIPVLGNCIPGLEYSIGASGAGVCVDFRNSKEILEGLSRIEAEYEGFEAHARKFFDSTDNFKTMQKIIRQVEQCRR